MRATRATKPLLALGTRVGQRVVIGACRVPRAGQSYRRYLVRCDCGRERRLWHHDLVKSEQCGVCSARDARLRVSPERLAEMADECERSEVAAEILEAAQAWPQLWRSDDALSLDACAELAVSLDGMTLREIGIVLGMSAERVRQIEAEALCKLAALREMREMRGVLERWTWWDAIEEAA